MATAKNSLLKPGRYGKLLASPCGSIASIYGIVYWLAAEIDRVAPEALNSVSYAFVFNKGTYEVELRQLSVGLRTADNIVKVEVIEINVRLFSRLQWVQYLGRWLNSRRHHWLR